MRLEPQRGRKLFSMIGYGDALMLYWRKSYGLTCLSMVFCGKVNLVKGFLHWFLTKLIFHVEDLMSVQIKWSVEVWFIDSYTDHSMCEDVVRFSVMDWLSFNVCISKWKRYSRTHAVRVKLMTCKFFNLKLIIYTTLSIMYSLDIFYMVFFIVHAGN